METVYVVMGGGWESQETPYAESKDFLKAKQLKKELLQTEKYVDYFYIQQVYRKMANNKIKTKTKKPKY